VEVRPSFCIIGSCTPVREFHRRDQKHLAAGGSYFCAGVMDREENWQVGETSHVNLWCLCVYSPCKGWVRFLISRDDVEIIDGLMRRLKRYAKDEVADSLVRRQGEHGCQAPAADTAT